MNTLEQASLEHPDQGAFAATTDGATPPVTVDQSVSSSSSDPNIDTDDTGDMDLTPPKISGFDGGGRSFLKEPSLYLSIAIVAVANWVCLNKTPAVFWVSLVAMTAIAVVFHFVAERFLFRTKKEFEFFKAPFEGVFVVTFGSILPGLGLLAYAIYSMSTAVKPNLVEVLGKLALLLVVPIFNFAVWSAVRRGYLVRPRYIGLMNGFALGLSTSWTIIWLKAITSHDSTCKFGWMLLLCSAPFLLFAAGCLSHDLWQKTELNIRKITTTFSVLGCLLSVLFVFTPMTRTFYIQSQLTDARSGSLSDQAKAIAVLRSVASDKDLRPSKHPVSGFSLASLLIPNRGLDTGAETDRNLYFRITGKPYFDEPSNPKSALNENFVAGGKIAGLSLLKSLVSGNIDANTLSSSVDWALTFHNSSTATQEACGEISVPKNAVVSRVTLWIDGEPREAAFASKSRVQAAYDAVVAEKRDPLLVTMSAPDRVLFQCFPIPANGGEMKIRLGFKMPLETKDGKICSMELPKLVSSNFNLPKRHRVSLTTKDVPVHSIDGMVTSKTASGYVLSGIIKPNDKGESIRSVAVERKTDVTEVATMDWYSKEARYIIERIREIAAPVPKRVLVVVDTSASLKRDAAEIKEALASIPARLKPMVYFASQEEGGPDAIKPKDTSKETDAKETTAATVTTAAKETTSGKEMETAKKKVAPQDNAQSIDTEEATDEDLLAENEESTANKEDSHINQAKPPVAVSMQEALKTIVPELFVGGQDNGPALREAIEIAAEQPHSAVLWIHGPQPQMQNLAEPTALDLVHRVALYDMQIRSGQNTLPPALQVQDASHSLAYENVPHKSTADDLKKILAGWDNGVKKLTVLRTQTTKRPQTPIITDRAISSQVTCLWAKDEVARLMSIGEEHQAIKLASNYRLVSTITGAVVLENSKQYKANKLDPGDYRPIASGASSGGGLVGAPVDPRYGQSNEVGQLADFGYDTARDIARVLASISGLIALIIAIVYVRGQKSITPNILVKAAIFVIAVPTVIHLMGTFVINNFGGLGGGL